MEYKIRTLDRFIPMRRLIDFDGAYDKLTEEESDVELQFEMNASALCRNHKRQALRRQLNKIARINERIFKISPYSTVDKLQPAMVRLWPCQPRKKPVIRDERVLDLPEFNSGFHMNPIDWGSNDWIATSVTNKVLIGQNLDRIVSTESVFEYEDDRSTAVSWSPDGLNLAFGSEAGLLLVWYRLKKSITHKDICCFGRNCSITVIHWHPDSKTFAWGCTRGTISVRAISNKVIVNMEKAHKGCICSLKYSPGGNYLCSSGQDGFLRVWKGRSYDPYMEIEMANPSRAIAWHPWRTGLLAVGEGPPAPGSLSLWNVNTAKLLFMKKLPPSAAITALNFNKITGELVFAQSIDSGTNGVQSEIFVLGGPQYVTDSITGISGTVFALTWNADNSKLGAASSDETFQIWNFLKPMRCKRPFDKVDEDLNFLALKRFRCLIR